MVFVVERYLPGHHRSDLLRGLSRLAPAIEELSGEGAAVRYLGSTIVPEDEACFCEFEAPSEAAVAEANRRAGLPFARIVPALIVTSNERRGEMSVSTSAPRTVHIGRSRMISLIAAGVAVITVAAWAIASYGPSSGSEPVGQRITTPSVLASLTPQERQYVSGLTSMTNAQLAAAFSIGSREASALASLTPKERQYVSGIASMTFAQLAAAFSTNTREASVLASLTPGERRYIEGITALTQQQLAAAFGTGR